MFSLALTILCGLSVYLALEKDKENGRWKDVKKISWIIK